MDRATRLTNAAIMTLAVLALIGALYFLKPILVPVILALILATVLSPITKLLRRILPLGPTGAAVVLFLAAVIAGLYFASLTAESLIQASETLPSDVERLANRFSNRITDQIRDQPYLKAILPEPNTIDNLGRTNRELLVNRLSSGLSDLTGVVAQGFIVLILVVFLLAEIEMLTPKAIRFFSESPQDPLSSEHILKDLTHQIRTFLLARTLINVGFGLAVAIALRILGVNFAFLLGLIAGLTNFIPYVGQVIGGALPTVLALAQFDSAGTALIVAAVYLAIVGIEGYVLTPWILGRSLDLNGTTVLIACLFWGFLWGLIGLMIAMPITVCMKLVFQAIPELHRWAAMMSVDWQPPPPPIDELHLMPMPSPDAPLPAASDGH
ncbi:MAG: AI-2E family transporter [Isosphaeraceae bacterium]|nr:AI-2E family transporter [Isosphaeraceae bacterium]